LPDRSPLLEIPLAQNIVNAQGTVDVALYQPQKMRRRAINDFCITCQGGSPHNPQFNNASKEIRDCTASHCPLYLVRPFQSRNQNEPNE
jgi:hypothetical protein